MPFTTRGDGVRVFNSSGTATFDTSQQAPGTVVTIPTGTQTSNVTVALPTGGIADTSLDNLEATAINADLVPASTATIKLGSASKDMLEVHTLKVTSAGGGLVTLDTSGNVTVQSSDGSSLVMGPTSAHVNLTDSGGSAVYFDPSSGTLAINAKTSAYLQETTAHCQVLCDSTSGIFIVPGTGLQVSLMSDDGSAYLQFPSGNNITIAGPTGTPVTPGTPAGYLKITVNGTVSYLPFFR